MLLRRLLSLTSIKTSLPKTMTGFCKLVELYLAVIFSLQVICLREMPNWKINPISKHLSQNLKSLQSWRDGYIRDRGWLYFYDKADWSILLAGSSLVWSKCDLHTTDVLAYQVNLANLQCKVGWINTWHQCHLADRGQKCLQLLCMYSLSGCDTTSYPYDKGNVTSLSTMVSRNYQCLAIIGDVDTTHTGLMNAAMPSFVSL